MFMSALNYYLMGRHYRAKQYANHEQLQALMEKQKGRCAVCRANLKKIGYHKDHIVPLVLGGTNWIQNIQFLCPTCNLTKNRKHPVEFMQERGFLL